MNQEHRLIAESVDEWKELTGAKETIVTWNKKFNLPEFWNIKYFIGNSGAITKDQWLSDRQELGLDSPFTSPEEDEAWADAERRMDTIGQNGNTAEHYKEPPAIEYTRTAEQFLSQAADLLIERGKQYDKPGGERSMGSTVKAFNAITNKTLSESEGWLFMSILKRVRQYQGPYHKDSAEDGVSYSALEAEALERGL
jgi:hypothetical protein